MPRDPVTSHRSVLLAFPARGSHQLDRLGQFPANFVFDDFAQGNVRRAQVGRLEDQRTAEAAGDSDAVADLIESGYVERTRVGRRNQYTINPTVEMRHQLQRGFEIGALLELLQRYPPSEPPGVPRR